MSNQSTPQYINNDDTTSFDFNSPFPSNSIEIEEDSDMMGVLDALIELHQLDANKNASESYQQDYLSIVKAINLNEEMQRQVSLQIDFIDKQLELNTSTMTEARYTANAENRFGQRVFVHTRYDDPVNYFDKSELIETTDDDNTPYQHEFAEEEDERSEDEDTYMDEEEDENVDSEKSLQNKAWSRYERTRLLNGIQAEAKRTIAYDLMKKNEVWRVWDLDKIDQTQLENFPVGRLDWERISSVHVHSRTANECLMQWTTQEHPIINKKPWSKQESDRLSELVDEIGSNGQWERIAQELATNRTISQCFSHYMADKNNKAARSLKWTPEEDKKLAGAIKIFGNCNWQQVAALLKGRTGQQCLHRWAKSINPAIKRTKWTPEESELLKRAVQLYGEGNWRKIQRLIPERTDMQCRERWVNILQPSVKRTKMTTEEVEQLVTLVNEVGPKWSYIATFFHGRTDNNIMREYNLFLSKDKRDAEAQERELKKIELKKLKDAEKAEKKKKKEEALEAKKKKKEVGAFKKKNVPVKRGRKRKVVVSEDDDEEEEEDENVKTLSSSKAKRKKLQSDKEDEDSSSEDEYNPACAIVRQRRYSTRAQSRRNN